MNKRILGGLAAAVMLTGGLAFSSGVAQASAVDHCPEHSNEDNFKDQSGSSLNTKVLDAQTSFCVKGSTGNTGILIADGSTTLFAYLAEFGVDNGGENDPDVSYYVVYPPEQPDPVERQTTSVDCATRKFTTVNYEKPFVFDDVTETWKRGVEVEVDRVVRDATFDELAGAKCETETPPPTPTPTPTPTPEPEVEAIAPPAPTNRPPTQRPPDVVAASSPAQAPPAEVSALPPVVPAAGLPVTGIDGTGVTAIIALLLTSLGGAALFLSRRRSTTI